MENILQIRHSLHQNAGLSGDESFAHDCIEKYLRSLKPEILETHVGGYGIIAEFKGEKAGKTVAFRADTDALPIDEKEECTAGYSSKISGVGHKCGHDGHTAILLDFAARIAAERPKSGNVVLLFQPEEETGKGAAKLLASGLLEKLRVDAVFGLHNLPGVPLGQVAVKYGTFAAASCGMTIKLHGVEAHAAYPADGINPGNAVAEIIGLVDNVNSANMYNPANPDKFKQITLICVRLGQPAFGTSAGEAEVMLTLRAYSNQDMEQLLSDTEARISEISGRNRLKVEISYCEKFHALENRDEFVDIISRAATQENLSLMELDEPRRWSEDFADYLLKLPGAFFGLGAGSEHLPLHHPDYDFPDELIETGGRLFYRIAEDFLAR